MPEVRPNARSASVSAPRIILGVSDDPFDATQFFDGFAPIKLGGRLANIEFCRMEVEALINLAAYVPPVAMVLMNPSGRTTQALLGLGTRVLSVDGVDDPAEVLRLRTDHVAVGALGAEHLIGQGFRRLYFVGPGFPWAVERAKGFGDAARSRGIEPESTLFARAEWRDIVLGGLVPDLVRRMTFPAAVMAANDDIAARVIEVAVEQGLSVPGDLAVIGVDDRPSRREVAGVGLTSISLDRRMAGVEAAKLLRRVLGRGGSDVPSVPVRLGPGPVIARQSTQFVQYRDQRVNASMTFIHVHATEGINVDDVARAGAMSVSTLHRRFREATGRSPGEEIREVRLHAARRLVETTSESLSHICQECGFSSMSYMIQSFNRAFGAAPGKLRKQSRAIHGVDGAR